jgi:hypothetical protein
MDATILSIHKWQGIKNSDSKTVSGGYLFVKFNQNAVVIDMNKCSGRYHEGQIIGFKIDNVQSRKQAIQQFNSFFEIKPF